MPPRLWLASAAALTLVTAGAYVASPPLHGQAAPKAPGTDADRVPDVVAPMEMARDIRKAVEEATRHAQDVVRDLDVEVMVDDAMQSVVGLAGGRPRLGVSTRDLTAEDARAAGLGGIAGAYVTDVAPGSAAAKAGLQAGDVVTSIDGETVRSVRHLSRLISETADGAAVQVGYVRGTGRQSVAVTLEARPMTRSQPRARGADGEGPGVRGVGPDGRAQEFFYRRGPEGGMGLWVGRGRLGVMTQPLTAQLATYFGVQDGVLVTQVDENSPAAKAGLAAGDVITSLNGRPVKDAGDIRESLAGVEAGRTVAVGISRDRARQTLTVTMEASPNPSGDRPVPRRMRFTA